jgi:hypothetical protein
MLMSCKSGTLNLLETSRPVQACNEIALTLTSVHNDYETHSDPPFSHAVSQHLMLISLMLITNSCLVYEFKIHRALYMHTLTCLNPLTPELKPSTQRCLTRFFTGDFASRTVHLVNTCMKTQQMQQLFIQFINYVW